MRILGFRMTEPRVRKACDARGACITLALVLGAGAAQAGAWNEFETRCLLPIENVRAPDVSGLTAKSTISEEARAMMPDMEGVEYAIPGQPIIMVVATQEVNCMIIQTASTGEDGFAAAEAWVEANQANGRYENLAAIPMGDRNFNLGSTEWREPRLDLFGDARGDGTTPMFYVAETDLES